MDAVSGVVRTKGSQPFRLGKEYEIGVSAQDINAKTPQKSATHSLKILVGEREPQFYETQYIANIPETADEQYKWAIRHFKIFMVLWRLQSMHLFSQDWIIVTQFWPTHRALHWLHSFAFNILRRDWFEIWKSRIQFCHSWWSSTGYRFVSE